MKETYPLIYPAWPRTLLRDREERKQWKKTERQSLEALELELKRFGADIIAASRDLYDVANAAATHLRLAGITPLFNSMNPMEHLLARIDAALAKARGDGLDRHEGIA